MCAWKMPIWRKRWEILVFLAGAKAISMTIVKPCWANSASQYSARWTRIPAHSPYSPNMHRFHHNFLDPTTSPIITIILKEKMPPSPYTYIYVLQWCLHPHLKTQRTSVEPDHFSKRLNSAGKQQRSFSHTLRTWTFWLVFNYSTNTISCTHLDIVHSFQYV